MTRTNEQNNFLPGKTMRKNLAQTWIWCLE